MTVATRSRDSRTRGPSRRPHIDGHLLYSERLDQGLTLVALAEMLKQQGTPYTHQYLSALETGRRKGCSPKLIRALAEALDVDPRDLMHFPDDADDYARPSQPTHPEHHSALRRVDELLTRPTGGRSYTNN